MAQSEAIPAQGRAKADAMLGSARIDDGLLLQGCRIGTIRRWRDGLQPCCRTIFSRLQCLLPRDDRCPAGKIHNR